MAIRYKNVAVLLSTAAMGLAIGLVNSNPAQAITSTGNIEQIALPTSLAAGATESSTNIRLFTEQQNLTLESDLNVNHLVSGAASFTGNGTDTNPGTSGTLATGTILSSFLLHLDPAGTRVRTLSGSLTFDNPILGLIYNNSSSNSTLNNTDSILGGLGVTYETSTSRRFLIGENADSFTISADGKTLTLTMRAGGTGATNIDNLRVVTSSAVPFEFSPSLGLILGAGLIGSSQLYKKLKHKPELNV
jgi:ABC-type transport system substrate-binding protein